MFSFSYEEDQSILDENFNPDRIAYLSKKLQVCWKNNKHSGINNSQSYFTVYTFGDLQPNFKTQLLALCPTFQVGRSFELV